MISHQKIKYKYNLQSFVHENNFMPKNKIDIMTSNHSQLQTIAHQKINGNIIFNRSHILMIAEQKLK